MNRRSFLLTGAAAASSRVLPAAGTLRAGAATSNITPPLGCSLAGGMTDRTGTEVHDELQVRALAIESGGTRLAIATCDLCVVPRGVVDRAKRLIEEHAGIPPAHVLVASTHTHSAPPAAHLFQSRPDPHYVDWLPVRIADGVRRALNHLEPARIGWGVGREERLVFNRRFRMRPGTIPPDPFGRTTDQVLMNPGVGNPNVLEPAGPTDPAVGVLAVEAADGRPIAVLGNYALHYVGGEAPGHISADYFAAWAAAMEALTGLESARRYPPFVPILTNGCSGNINNVDVKRPPRARAEPYQQMRRVAEILAAECLRTWRAADFTDSAELGGSLEELELALRLPSAAEIAAARRLLATAGPGPYRQRDHIYARETLDLAEYPKTVRTVVQALRIGSLGIATFPGEAFVELGIEVKAHSPFQPTFLIELANDYRGYIPTVAAFEVGGYETWRAKSSCLEVEAAPKLVAAVRRRLEALKRGENT